MKKHIIIVMVVITVFILTLCFARPVYAAECYAYDCDWDSSGHGVVSNYRKVDTPCSEVTITFDVKSSSNPGVADGDSCNYCAIKPTDDNYCYSVCYVYTCGSDDKWQAPTTYNFNPNSADQDFPKSCVRGNSHYADTRGTYEGGYCNYCGYNPTDNACKGNVCYCNSCQNGRWVNYLLTHTTNERTCLNSAQSCSYSDAVMTFKSPKTGSCESGDPSTSSNPSTASSSTEVQASTNPPASQNQGGNQNNNQGGSAGSVSKNPPTGPLLIIVAWIVALGAIIYSFLFFKKNSSI